MNTMRENKIIQKLKENFYKRIDKNDELQFLDSSTSQTMVYIKNISSFINLLYLIITLLLNLILISLSVHYHDP